MIFKKLIHWSNTEKIYNSIKIASIIFIVIFPIMIHYYIISGYPANFLESQLSFNGEILKDYYNEAYNYYYKNSQIFASILIFGYGMLLFTLSIYFVGKYRNSPRRKKFGILSVIMSIVGISSDITENFFIFLMLGAPLTFPNEWAIIHSFFALIKYISIIFTLSWIGYGLVASTVNQIRNWRRINEN